MAKILSVLRKTSGAPGVPPLIIVGQPIADGGAVVKEIKYYKHESTLLTGPQFVVHFIDTNTRAVIPLSSVLEVLYEVDADKKEKVKVPALE